MNNCIFCKIGKGEIESAKIWEDNEFLAILDSNPNTKGMTLIMPKEHYDSYAFDMPDKVYQKLMLTAKKVAKILEKGLDVTRIAMVMEGTGVNHAHIKMYPLYGIEKGIEKGEAPQRVFFDKYQGYISTQLGPQIDISELNSLVEKIKKKNKNIKWTK